MNKKLTTEDFWDSGYESHVFYPIPEKYPIVKEIKIFFKEKNFKNILEIGCFPGRFLYYFGKLGFILNGIDQTKFLPKMIEWFKSNNFKIGEFINQDIFNIDISKIQKYDVVFSSGFVEHFTNFDEIIRLHTKLVKKDGIIFITAPNFSGYIQKKLHQYLDKKSFDSCYLPAMDLKKWKEILVNENCEIIKATHIGGFDFWVIPEERSLFKKIIIKMIRGFMPLRFIPNCRVYSPEIILIAKKI